MDSTTVTFEEIEQDAAEMGCEACPECWVIYYPAPGYVNHGHRCDGNGKDDQYLIP